jgi:hypothetical protein
VFLIRFDEALSDVMGDFHRLLERTPLGYKPRHLVRRRKELPVLNLDVLAL